MTSTKSKIEQEAEEYYMRWAKAIWELPRDSNSSLHLHGGIKASFLAGAKKLAELLERRTELVEYEDVYSEEVIPLSALREIMGEKE